MIAEADAEWVFPHIATRTPLDRLIGPQCPGLPVGRLVHIYGAPGTGKTTLGRQIVGNISQAAGMSVEGRPINEVIDLVHALTSNNHPVIVIDDLDRVYSTKRVSGTASPASTTVIITKWLRALRLVSQSQGTTFVFTTTESISTRESGPKSLAFNSSVRVRLTRDGLITTFKLRKSAVSNRQGHSVSEFHDGFLFVRGAGRDDEGGSR